MKLQLYRCLLITLVLGSVAPAPRADEAEPVAFDLFRSNGSIAAWMDLSSFISSRRVEQLNDGIDVAIECRMSLRRPRRLWGSETMLEVEKLFRIEYRLITEDFRLREWSADSVSELAFASLAKLHQYLADSIIVVLGSITQLDKQHQYYVEMKFTSVAMTSFNVSADEEGAEASESAIRFLFRQFLEITSFGREDFEVRSRRFSLEELETLE